MLLQRVLSLLLFLVTTSVLAQNGTIAGKVADGQSGQGLLGAAVRVDGTSNGALTDLDGKFSITGVKPGTYNLIVSFVTYRTDTIKNVVVTANNTTEVSTSLREEAKELGEVVIAGQADRTSETVLLKDRKNAVEMVQNIGAQEISRKGVSDAEGAVTQITGVSKQEGVKNVFVRGLGDRYNSTSMNGLPLPSEDPEYKNITLGFFSSDIINSLSVNKTFNPAIYGDVTGANIDIVSKELTEERELTVSLTGGVNSQAVSKDFYRPDGAGFFGKTNNSIPISNLRQYGFSNSYQPSQVSGPIANSALTITAGNRFGIGRNSMKTFLVAAMASDYSYKEGKVRQVNPVGAPRQDFNYQRYNYSFSNLLLANATYEFSNQSSIAYNAIYIHDNKQSVGNYVGFSLNGIDDITDPDAYKTFVRRQQVNNNKLFVNQLVADLKLTDKLSIDLKGAFNTVRGDEPDRRTNYYIADNENYLPNSSSPAFNHRYYSSLKEDDIAANVAAVYQLGEKENNKISIGYNYRSTKRDFESVQFNFDWNTNPAIDVNNPDAVFNQQSIDNNTFVLETGRGTGASALAPFLYKGDRAIHAATVSITYDIRPDLTLSVGGRLEKVRQEVEWDTNLDVRNPNVKDDNIVVRDPLYILPSLNVKYNLSDNNIMRLSASKSYTLPQFKEVAPFFYEDVNIASFGNPGLLPAENYNVDLKYEHYFTSGELVALTGFYKKIDNAINRVQVASAANELSYVNTGNADVVGAELELRKNVFEIYEEYRTSLNVGTNVSYLYSKQELLDVPTDQLTFQPTNKTSTLEGASTLLVNADVTFSKEGRNGRNITSTLVLNYFSDRIFSIGAPTGNRHIYENGIPTLDLISKFALNTRMTIGLNFKNMLNPTYLLTKEIDSGEKETISSFKKGVTTSLGFTYRF